MDSFKPLALMLIFICMVSSVFAQADLQTPEWHFIDNATIPSPSADMPDYVKLLYSDKVKLSDAEKSFEAYYDVRGWEHQKEDLEQDAYTKFFHYWYIGAQDYVDDNGFVKRMDTHELIQFRKANLALDQNIQVSSRSANSQWSFLGPRRTVWGSDDIASQPPAPWQVNVYTIAVAPSNPSILFCGSETGGLYKTTDKGVNWVPFDNYNWGDAILSIAIHPTDPNIVYVGASNDIFKTTDGGTTWNIIKTESGLSCNSLAISPTSPATILAGTNHGLLKSTNSGANWQLPIDKSVDDVKFRPGDGTVIYVIAETGAPDTYTFYKSTDSGASFNPSMTGWPDVYVHSGSRISVTPAAPDYVYAVLLTQDDTGNNRKPYILKSTNSASSWTTVAIGNTGDCPMSSGQGYYDLDIEVSHVNPEHVIAATTSAYKSTDGGITWNIVGGYGGSFSIHPDIQEIVTIMDGTTENTWIATDGGPNFSTDFYTSTANWEARMDGVDGTNFWGFSQGWNEDFIVGGRYHNGNTAIHENYPNKHALRLGGAEAVTGWAMHGRERHVAFSDISELTIPSDITDPPKSGSFLFTKYPQNYYYGSAYSRVMIDLEDYMTVYLGEGSSFWRSKDGGASWEAIFTFPGGAKPYHFDISRANPDYIYQTTNQGFYRSTDRGNTFTKMNLPSGLSNWHSQNLRVAASSTSKDRVWILNNRSGASSSTGRVFVSDDGGSTWTDLTTNALAGRRWVTLAHQAGTDGGIYIASNRGAAGTMPSKVMYRDNNLADWQDFSIGLPQSANPIKLLPFYRDGKLRWGGNRGAWEVDFYEENWTPIVQPFVSGKNQICSRDTIEFDSYSVAKGSVTYAWVIPDATWNSPLNQREVKALFPAGGTYSATLTITQDGQSYSKSVEVTVSNECDAEQIAGNCLSLAGVSSDYASTSNPLNITSNTITMSAWIKPKGLQSSNAGIIFTRGSSAAGINFKSNNELGFHWNNSQWNWHSGHTVPADEWTHVALVVSPSETIIYMNGVPAVNTANPAPFLFDASMAFGADPNWGARRFKGEMDEILIYNRTLSQNEIRELMHLTRVPATEVDLVGYWQFNRSSGLITDRVGSNHANLIGGASRTTSTVPVGSGESSRLAINTGGAQVFGNTNLTLEFPNGATAYPDGELCVTRIDHEPNIKPVDYVTPSYWVVHNYGNNTTFDELSGLTFTNILVDQNLADNPNEAHLYKRSSNADGNNWTDQDMADAVTQGANGNISFAAGNGQTSFSQFIIGYAQAPLPLELLSFDIRLNDKNQVDLHWKTANEKNLSNFEIQRSRDGISFEKMKTVDAFGNSNQIIPYHTTDNQPLRGTSYYRLKMIDEDESFTFSDTKSIVFDALAEKVVVYPNPLTIGTPLHIKTELGETIKIKFFAMDGDDSQEFTFKGDSQISLDGLKPGAYSYLISTDSWRKTGVLIVKHGE